MAQDTRDGELWQVEMPMVLGTIEDIDNTFHVQNKSPTGWERNNVIQRKGPVNVVCSLVEVVHGKLGPDPETASDDEGALATLLVFQFRFIPQKHSRRIIRASIHVEFSGVNAQSTPPTVWAIAPYDTLTVVPTTEHEEDKHGIEGNVGSPSAAPFQAGIKANFERTRS